MKKIFFKRLASFLSFSVCFSFVFLLTATASVLSDAVFLGDSTTNSLRFWGVLDEGENSPAVWTGTDCTLSMWGLSEKEILITREMEKAYRKKLDEGLFKKDTQKRSLPVRELSALIKPRKMIITLGINGCVLMNKTDFTDEYNSLINTVLEVSPDTKIYLSSIFPVAKNARISNQKIDLANTWIAELASHRQLPFLNLNPHLKGADGYALDGLVDSADGIHWNQAGCRKIVSLFRELIEKTENENKT